jgi:hypothetical protein
MKHLFPGRPRSSNEEAVNESALCDDEENPEDVSTLTHRINTKDICLLCGEFGHNMELWYRCVICSGWVRTGCSSADTAVNFNCDFCK